MRAMIAKSAEVKPEEMAWIGLDEQGYAAAGFAEPVDHWLQMIVQSGRIESALGRALLAPLGDEADRVRLVTQRDLQHFLGCGHLEVEWDFQLVREARNVLIGNVPTVLAQMRGDAVRACFLRQQRGADGIGVGRAARIADGRHMIDVDAEAQMAAAAIRACGHARLPGFVAGIAASSGGRSSAS